MKVAIAGFGVEGQASFRYYSQLGADITIVDENKEIDNLPDGVATILGEGAFERLEGFELVIRSPQINPERIKTDGKIWSATNEFFAKCTVPIIGVTGTKGKGTTCSLIAKILEEAGFKVWLVGNIGVPALDVLEEIEQYAKSNMQSGSTQKSDQIFRQAQDDAKAVVVFELSSFQLWDIEKSPETAVCLMIEPDHLDVHASMEEYVNAKANITLRQKSDDLLIHHPSNKYSLEIAKKSSAQKRAFMKEPAARIVIRQLADPDVMSSSTPADLSAQDDGRGTNNLQSVIPAEAGISKSDQISRHARDDSVIVIENQPICRTDEVGLLGEHNLENITAAITAAWQYTQDISAIKQAVTSFRGLPHRLEFVREVGGIKYYNDSQATGPGSCLAALRSFTEPTVLILGGADKGVDMQEVISELDEQRNCVVLIGKSSNALAEKLQDRGFKSFVNLGENVTMQQILHEANSHAQEGGVVLLSPAHASFDMFKNYQDRGDQFKQAVNEL